MSEVEVGNYEQNMQDAISVFPRLLTGLDVNVKFDRFDWLGQWVYAVACLSFYLDKSQCSYWNYFLALWIGKLMLVHVFMHCIVM